MVIFRWISGMTRSRGGKGGLGTVVLSGKGRRSTCVVQNHGNDESHSHPGREDGIKDICTTNASVSGQKSIRQWPEKHPSVARKASVSGQKSHPSVARKASSLSSTIQIMSTLVHDARHTQCMWLLFGSAAFRNPACQTLPQSAGTKVAQRGKA